jgi:hypothetical protein
LTDEYQLLLSEKAKIMKELIEEKAKGMKEKISDKIEVK